VPEQQPDPPAARDCQWIKGRLRRLVEPYYCGRPSLLVFDGAAAMQKVSSPPTPLPDGPPRGARRPQPRRLGGGVAVLRESLTVAHTRAEGRAERAELALAAERSRADDLRGRVDVMRGDLEEAQKQATEALVTLRQAAREGLRPTCGLAALFQAAWRGDGGAIGR